MSDLLSTFPRSGKVEWIGARSARRGPLKLLDEVEIDENGLVGDHRARPGKRAVTLIQHEHLPVMASLCGKQAIDPADLRRNIVVSGINLIALRKSRIRIGTAELQATGICAPCSRMEDTLGPGGYNAMRGHGGITAEVISGGTVKLGDAVSFISTPSGD